MFSYWCLHQRFPKNFEIKLAKSLCEWFFLFIIKVAVEILLELNSRKNVGKQKRSQEIKVDQSFSIINITEPKLTLVLWVPSLNRVEASNFSLLHSLIIVPQGSLESEFCILP